MKSTATAGTAVATAILAVSLSACGGSGSTTDSVATGAQEADTRSGQGGSKAASGQPKRRAVSEGGKKTSRADASSPSAKKVQVKVSPLRVSGGGSKPFRSKGGDNSIQTYGNEGGETELAAAATALHDYYVAFAGDDWEKACSYMTKSLAESLERFGAQASGSKSTTCAESFAALYGARKRSGEVRHQLTEVDAASLRREGDQAFLIYHGTDYDSGGYYGVADLYSMPMRLEGGSWKVGLAIGSTMGIAKSLVKKR